MSVRRELTRAGKTLLDLALLALVFGVAFLIRFEGAVPPEYVAVFAFWLPYVLAVKLGCLLAFGVRKLTWRYVSLFEAWRIFTALAAASTLLLGWRLACGLFLYRLPPPRHEQIPFGILLVDFFLSFLVTVGLRITIRLWSERSERNRQGLRRPARVPTLLVGAGRRGALVAREIAARPDTGIDPLAFLDDDPGKLGMTIHGIPVVGTTGEIGAVARRYGARQALITLADTSAPAVLRIVSACEACHLRAKIIPELPEILSGKGHRWSVRDLAVEDLLPRHPVPLGSEGGADVVRGRTVLITGAGGSIGSELCREVCRLGPASLVLVEQAENSLFHIHRELCAHFPRIEVAPCVADVCDEGRMRQLFARHRPAVVFHAAAHKHVPLMESNPGEAIKNNVIGTKNLADLADSCGVGQFVMISTDKAVNPASVMGVSKRIAELYIQALSQRSATRFVAVRFGNVLASAGSVVPIFKEQIAQGGPVTVTHPEMRRYFMTIPEACQLVLQAASMGKGGEIFILDMGEPIRILDLARDLIRLSGLVPGEDIEIRFTGIRPGEKLFEELSFSEESAARTQHPRILIGRLKAHEWHEINRHIEELYDLAGAEVSKIHAKFKEIVREYVYDGSDLSDRDQPLAAGMSSGSKDGPGAAFGQAAVPRLGETV